MTLRPQRVRCAPHVLLHIQFFHFFSFSLMFLTFNWFGFYAIHGITQHILDVLTKALKVSFIPEQLTPPFQLLFFFFFKYFS